MLILDIRYPSIIHHMWSIIHSTEFNPYDGHRVSDIQYPRAMPVIHHPSSVIDHPRYGIQSAWWTSGIRYLISTMDIGSHPRSAVRMILATTSICLDTSTAYRQILPDAPWSRQTWQIINFWASLSYPDTWLELVTRRHVGGKGDTSMIKSTDREKIKRKR